MKHLLTTICFLLFACGCGLAAVPVVIECDEELNVSLTNVSDDTLYVFNSYFNVPDVKLFRYDSTLHQFKYSMLPLVPYLGLSHTTFRQATCFPHHLFDVTKYPHRFEFACLPPHEKITFKLSQTPLMTSHMFEDFSLEAYQHRASYIQFKKIDKPQYKGEIYVEFAIYRDIKWCYTDAEVLYRSREWFDKALATPLERAANNYETIGIVVQCDFPYKTEIPTELRTAKQATPRQR